MPGAPGISLTIRDVRVVPYALAFRRPFATAREAIALRRGFTVWVADTAGRWGVGEAAPLPGFGMERLEECAAALEAGRGALTGRAIALPRSWSPRLQPGFGILPDADLRPAARHGLECALLDLATQQAGIPLSRWFHPLAATQVPVNATVGAAAPEEAARQAEEQVARGFTTLKIKVGVGGDAADAARLAAVRAAAGPAVRLRIDANEAWDEAQALRMLRRLAPLGVEYAEQPVPATEIDAMARLSAASPVPIAADEMVTTEARALAVLRARAAHVLVLKPMALGGLIAALRVAHRALAGGVPVVLTTMLEGVYARMAAVHAAAALPALAAGRVVLPACGLATGHLLREDLVALPPLPQRGSFAVPAAPGLGIGGTPP
jgi:o-succinylbenzoate synthase